MTIECRFDIRDKVTIKEIQQIGRVKSIWYVTRGIEYEVRYFYEGKPLSEYFFEDELDRVKE